MEKLKFESIESKSENNIYDKEKFSPEKAKEYVDDLTSKFKDFYSSIGYNEEPSVQISSGIDPTVRFIGSHISVFKHYLIGDNVINPGVFMEQPCIRTRNADKLLDDSFSPQWGSYFLSIGTLASPDRLKEACNEAFDFFERKLGIARENLLIRINSADEDLMETCRERCDNDNLEIDTQKPEYYRHKIGEKGITGRNFNIALRNPNGAGFADVGNIIVLENSEKKLGIETALGTSVILKQLYGLDHVQDCNPVIGLEKIKDQMMRRKFEDSIITSTILLSEGLRPFGGSARNRLLKKYMNSLIYFKDKSGLDMHELQTIISEFEKKEIVDSDKSISNYMIEYIKALEGDKK